VKQGYRLILADPEAFVAALKQSIEQVEEEES
jgi:hypothetical protein